MACYKGIDKVGKKALYRPQPAPARWGQTYRSARRQDMKAVWAWVVEQRIKTRDRKIWCEQYYSERHFANYRTSNRLQQETITRAASI